MRALKTYFTDFERMTSSGEVEIGDVRFIVYRDDFVDSAIVVESDISTEDKIVETKNQSGVTYGIVSYSLDPAGLGIVFHCRRP
jgi:hypothetical protein